MDADSEEPQGSSVYSRVAEKETTDSSLANAMGSGTGMIASNWRLLLEPSSACLQPRLASDGQRVDLCAQRSGTSTVAQATQKCAERIRCVPRDGGRGHLMGVYEADTTGSTIRHALHDQTCGLAHCLRPELRLEHSLELGNQLVALGC